MKDIDKTKVQLVEELVQLRQRITELEAVGIEQGRVERALREREQYSTLRGIIDSANALIFSVDRQYRYTSFNQGHAAVMKALYGAEIEIGHSLLDYMTLEEDREIAKNNLDRALAGEQLVEGAYSGEEPRSRRYFQVSHSPIANEEGQIIGVAVLAQDMTERKLAEAALHRLNRELRAISNCNQILLRAVDEQTLLNDICRVVCDEAGYRMAWVGYAENDEARTIHPVAWAGVEDRYLEQARLTWSDTERGRGPAGTAIRSGETTYAQDFTTDPRMTPWRESALQRGYRSSITLPLKDENARTFGILNIYSSEPNAFTPDEIQLLEELAGDLAFGINTLRMRAERKRAEEALIETHSLLEQSARFTEALLSAIPTPVFYKDREGRYLGCNRAFTEVMGVTPAEITGKTVYELWPSEHAQVYHNKDLELMENSALQVYEFMVRDKYGVDRPVIYAKNVFRDANDQVAGIVGAFLDITERKKAEMQILASEQLFRALVENSPDFIARYDREFRRVYVNPAIQKLFGRPVEDVLNQTPVDQSPVYAPDVYIDQLRQVIENAAERAIEMPFRTTQGEMHWGHMRFVPEFGPDGRVASVMAIGRDIYEIKQAEQERLAHLRFFECMDQINRAIQGTTDLEQMMSDVLDSVLSIFECDRAYLLYPCDPEAATWWAPMERNRPEYPGVLALGQEMPMDPDVAETFRLLLASDGPVKFGPGTPYPLPKDVSERFGFKCFMSMALYPKVGQPWQFGIHQCAYARIWTAEEERLFQEIGRRLGDGLGTLLAYHHLQDSEERYRLIAENTADTITVFDLNLKPVYVSPSAFRLRGYTVEETMAQSLDQILTPASLQTVNKLLAEQVALGAEETADPARTVLLELEVYCKNGATIWVELAESILRDIHLKPTGVLAVVRDITERKWAERERERLMAQISEQARELRQILATVPEGVLLLDGERRIVQANPVAEKDLATLAGVKAGDVLTHLGNRSLTELLTSPPTKGLWHEVKADQRIFEVIARPMDNDLEPEYWVLVINDVTQAREVREQLQQQERMAAVGQLAAGIAHDFNNIMAIIVLYAQMTAQVEALPAHVQERMMVINKQARHATRLIQQILDFSRRSVLEQQPLDLLPLLKEQCKLLERTLPENIEIDLDYEPAEYIVNADLTRMQQVLMNLAVNARDAMPKGGELRFSLSRTAPTDKIRCVTCDEVPSGEWVRIAVADTGSGIPSEALPHIFEPFFTTKAPGQGTGLGLSQVYGIVGAHEGHIDVRTKTGKGTTFIIYLPPLLTHRPETLVLETQSVVAGGGETLLVVEDDITLRKALVDTLSSLNYQVLEAANGQEALDTLQQRAREIALVISDLVMPGMGGQALFHAMRRCNLTLPVIMLTGHPMEQELRSLQAEGLAGWLLKPPDIAQLSRLLAQVLKGKD